MSISISASSQGNQGRFIIECSSVKGRDFEKSMSGHFRVGF